MKIISLNAQGLSEFSKFKRILLKLLQHSPDVILFQETFNPHITESNLNFKLQTWSSIWKGQIYATPLVATLISPSLSSTLTFKSSDHRILDIQIVTQQLTYINVRNIYAPAESRDQRPFWSSFPNLPPIPNIAAGDFNAVLTPNDHISSNQYHRTPLDSYILPHLENLIDTGALSPKPAFTSYHQRENTWSKSRIDFIFISPSILTSPSLTTINLGTDSDHRALLLTQLTNNNKSPTWRFNSSLLNSKKHRTAIEQIILSHPPPKHTDQWDDLKDSIRTYCKIAGKNNKNKIQHGIRNLTN